uniref:hypothetical protein n=1 Tax=Facilibium subflavum TaxID=2219058 RepID=UPI0013C31579
LNLVPLGYDPFILEQKITVELNPLDETLSTKPLTLISNEYQNKTPYAQFKGLMLSNFHLLDLNVDLSSYGFSGDLLFQLSYDDRAFHPDYLFLYQNVPLSIALTIEHIYVFDDPDKKGENYKKTFYLQGVANLQNNEHLQFFDPLVGKNTDKQTSQFEAMLPSFKLSFCDVIQSFWREHHPIYIDFNKSYIDVFEENNFFQAWATLDASKCKKLAVKQKQIFVSTKNASFYDYFIEALDHYGVYLIYDYESLTKGKATYQLFDSLTDIQKPTKGSGMLTSMDLGQIKDILCHVTPPWYVKENTTLNIADSNIQTQNANSIMPNDFLALGGFKKTQMLKIADKKIYDNTAKWYTEVQSRRQSCQYTYLVQLRQLTPFMPMLPSYQPVLIDQDQWHCSIGNFSQNLLISRQKWRFTQNKATKAYVKQKIIEQNYESEEDKDRFEKITMIGESHGITHFTSIESTWLDGKSQQHMLPDYQHFSPILLDAEITIGKNVDESVQYGYKFYQGQTETEGSFSDDTSSNLDAYTYAGQSEKTLCYALKLPTVLYKSSDAQNSVFAAIDVSTFGAHTFYPLRNGDKVLLEIVNAEMVLIKSLRDNTILSQDKASEKMVQRMIYGAQQECELSYTQDNQDQVFQVKQTTKDGKGVNILSFSNKSGVTLAFSDKKEESE